MPNVNGVEVNWYENNVRGIIEGASDEIIKRAAFSIEAEAKINVTENGQVDTGFMRNSIYAKTKDTSGYNTTDADGTYTSQRTGQAVKRRRADEADLQDADAVVHVAAEYAIYQEMDNPFLYNAMETVIGQFGGIVEQVRREGGL